MKGGDNFLYLSDYIQDIWLGKKCDLLPPMSAYEKENVAVASANGVKDDNASPPKPAKTAFMCFSVWWSKKKKEVGSSGNEIQHVAEAWRTLSSADRAFWDEEARKDKLRFSQEKAAYKGPWEPPKRRAKKHPLAPKRPMSAFLKYSQSRRAHVKKENPDMSNTDVSRLLGELWRNASPKERAPFIEVEEKERALYKAAIAKWRADQARFESNQCLNRSKHRSNADEEQNIVEQQIEPISHIREVDNESRHRHGYGSSRPPTTVTLNESDTWNGAYAPPNPHHTNRGRTGSYHQREVYHYESRGASSGYHDYIIPQPPPPPEDFNPPRHDRRYYGRRY